MATNECGICCETFNKTTRKPVKCGACDIAACKACVARYLMDTIKDAHCMGCQQAWNREKLVDAFSITFVNSTYKSYRERVLLDREKAMLPETIPYVDHVKRIRKIDRDIETHKAGRRDMLEQARCIRRSNHNADDPEAFLRVVTDIEIEAYRHEAEWKMLQDLKHMLTTTKAKVPKKQFIRGCPNGDCRGFIDTKWTCSLCDAHVCKDCHEVVGDQEEHTCTPDNVATAKLIMKDSKPCPKCSTMIFKIDGCDQMFCVQCHTAFSWRTGEIESGTIHNPHYYELLRRSGVTPPRNIGDQVCGGLPHYLELMAASRDAKLPKTLTTQILDMVRLYHHISRVEMNAFRADAVADNRDLRVQFLMQEIDETSFKRKLQQREKRNQRNREVTSVFQVVTNVVVDILTRYIRTKHEVVLHEMPALVDIANNEFTSISKRYDNVTPRILGTNYIVAKLAADA